MRPGFKLYAAISPENGANIMFIVGEFKGNAVITLKRTEDDKYPFTFGLAKAKLILEHFDDIKNFYEQNKDKPRSSASSPNQG
jgi:hypothetical protein